MTGVRIALTTVDSLEQARRIARHMVEHRLAACVNIIDRVHSIYRWQDAIEEATEFLLLIKTDAEHLAAVETALHQIHSYDLPEFLVLSPEGGSEGYLGWVHQNLG